MVSTTTTSIWRRFPNSFWVANAMEIFERMGWYGFFAVSTLYLTGDPEQGMLGMSSEDRGVIQGLSTFFLYLFPAVFGALADRYGFKTMFLASCAVMAPAYLLLGVPRSFWGFFAVYVLVAVGHGMFKPVVISTVARTTDESTGTLGFGIFYMMVNIGGFVGPIVAGVVRGWDWSYVFLASSGWIVLMGITCLTLYREPEGPVETGERRTLGAVMGDMVEVVGNPRFFLLVGGLMVLLVLGSKWMEFATVAKYGLIWLALNASYDVLLFVLGGGARGPWFLQRLRIGEGRYLLFLLLMAGFWTAFNQIFMTLPEYIRDYVDTSDVIRSLDAVGVNLAAWGPAVLDDGQIKPEHLINLNAFGIILFQVLISYLARKLKPFTTIISGVAVTVVSFLMYLLGAGGWVVISALLVFSVGEMLASPKSKEYAGRIAPPDRVGMYMGFFYWCVALGNLFGGLLSGVMYGKFGPKGLDRPDVMWISFAIMAAVTAVALAVYNHWVQWLNARETASVG